MNNQISNSSRDNSNRFQWMAIFVTLNVEINDL